MYQILTDSCCDFTEEQYARRGLKMVPLTLEFRGQATADRNDESLKTLYDGLRAGERATTSAVNPEQWRGAMEEALCRGQDVLALAFSSGLSATCQSARMAAEELMERYPRRKILVADTLCASLGQGLLAHYACKLRDAGKSLEEVYAWVEENKRHICHWFTVDDLLHLKRGGRLGATAAMMGTMLNIKPVLHMNDEGRLVNMARARGRKAALDALVKKFQELGVGYDNETVFLSHGDCPEDAAYVEKALGEQCGVREVLTGYVGAVIGTHAGPGTVALFFLGQKR